MKLTVTLLILGSAIASLRAHVAIHYAELLQKEKEVLSNRYSEALNYRLLCI